MRYSAFFFDKNWRVTLNFGKGIKITKISTMSNIPELETKAKNEYMLGIDAQNKWTWHFCNKGPLQLYPVNPKKQNKTKQKGAKMRWRVRKRYFKRIRVEVDKQVTRFNNKNNVRYYITYYNTS